MHSPQMITYVIKPGDNLYHLAKHYRTTVPYLLAVNPGIDPYNLEIGSKLNIIPGDGFTSASSEREDCTKKIALISDMRLAWSQHVYWTRMLLISIAQRLKDLDTVTERLMQNPQDIGNIFAQYYSPDTSEKIILLLDDHIQIGAALITALSDKEQALADTLNKRWYINADQMVDAFSSINPYYDHREIHNMLYKHLDLTKVEVAKRLAGDFPADIKAFDEVELEAVAMSDMFALGIIKQFPQMFT